MIAQFKLLPRGFAKPIATKMNCSVYLVYKVVKGKRNNIDIELALLELVQQAKEKLNRLKNLSGF